jgi:hypothetical protein
LAPSATGNRHARATSLGVTYAISATLFDSIFSERDDDKGQRQRGRIRCTQSRPYV